MSNSFEQARALFTEGVRQHEAGNFTEAERQFEASLALLPDRPSTLANLGATRLKLGKAQEALQVLEQALAQEADATDALQHHALALGMLGRHEEALVDWARVLALRPADAKLWLLQGESLQHLERLEAALGSYDAALARDPALGQAWSRRGGVLKELGRLDEAAAAFQQAIDHGDDPELNGYFLASLNGRDQPEHTPLRYVEFLFDEYADKFDEHLVQVLNYRAPRVLAAQLANLGRTFSRALDLGCGTGLCGPLVKPLAQALDGVDLSGNMLSKAAKSGAYQRLVQDDIVHYLETTQQRYELVVSADVFIYVGALENVFDGVSRVLAPGGVFCFSVELAPDDTDFVLRTSQRYAHSERYLRALALGHGFEVQGISHEPIREDQREPIAGLYVSLQAVGTA